MSLWLPRFGIVLAFLGFAAIVPAPVGAQPPVYVTEWGSPGSNNGEFNVPIGVATDALGNVYVTDSGYNERIQKFTSTGGYITQWGSSGSGAGQFIDPAGVATDAVGNVYVADNFNHRIQKFTGNGGYMTQWGTAGSGDGQFENAQALATDALGNVYVSDHDNNRIQKFTSSGSYLTQWGSIGSDDGQFLNPLGVATDASGYVFVVDPGNNRIQKFTSTGGYVTQWHLAGGGQPEDVATDAAGNVYVSDNSNYRIQKFTSNGGYITQWGSSGSGAGQFAGIAGIATDAVGNVYVSDFANYRIQKFGPPPPPVEPGSPRIMVHLRAPTAKNQCGSGLLSDCTTATTSGDLSTESGPFYFAYLLVAKGTTLEGAAGIQCGVTYDTGHPEDQLNGTGIDVFGWTLCATLAFPSPDPTPWPCPGSGILITWSSATCQTGPTAVAGFFYMGAYSADRLQIIPRPVDHLAKISDCHSAESVLTVAQLGSASFSAGATEAGCNPCLDAGCGPPIPVKATTWSGIKTLQLH